MKNSIKKVISLALSLVMVFGVFASITPVFAVAGDSEANPVIVTDFSELYDAMNSTNVTYVKMYFNGQRSNMNAKFEGPYGITVTTPKVLTIEGDNTIIAPTNGKVKALFALKSDVTVKGSGKLTYITNAENSIGAMFAHITDSLLTFDMTGTLESIATEDKDEWDLMGKILHSTVGRTYVNNGNFVGTYTGYDIVNEDENGNDYETGAFDIRGTAKMMIRGGNFNTYAIYDPRMDIFFPAINIADDHKSPGYVVIDGGTFNGIVSGAKSLDSYISQNCVIVDKETNKIFDYNGKKETDHHGVRDLDGVIDVINYNVVSVFQYKNPQFETTYPNFSDLVNNRFDKNLGESCLIAFDSEDVSDKLAENGFYMQDTLEIYSPNGERVYYNVDSAGLGVGYTCTFDKIGAYTVKMHTALKYQSDVIDSKQQVFYIDVACSHDFEVISNTASCTVSGEKVSVCKICGENDVEVVTAKGHKLIEGYLTDSMEHHKVCDNCLQIVESEEHNFVDDTCTVCGYVDGCEPEYMSHEYDNEYHWFYCMTHPEGECPNGGQLEKAHHVPTGDYNCQDGYECAECLWYYGETGKHLWVIDEVRCEEPTYESDGKIVYTCGYDGTTNNRGDVIHCKELLEIKVPALHHVWDYENPISNTATCEHDGVITYKCTEEGCTEIHEVFAEKTGHDNEWVVIVESTTEATGTKAFTCKNCGTVSKYEDIPMLPSGGTTEPEKLMKGDIDRDGDIDSMDYLYLKRVYFSQYPLSDTAIGDIDDDGAITSMDYLYLKRVYFSQYVIKS